MMSHSTATPSCA